MTENFPPSSPDDVRACFFNDLPDFCLHENAAGEFLPNEKCHKRIDMQCILKGDISKETHQSIHRIGTAMEAGIKPVLVSDCSSTTCYYLRDSDRRIVSIFKLEKTSAVSDSSTIPVIDENKVPFEEKNSLRKGFLSGGGSREIAAYLLDRVHISGVPNTTMISLKHPVLKGRQIGSMQAYAKHFCSAEDVSSSKFSADQVHKIALLDVRMLNTDRHAGNILVGVKKIGTELFKSARDLTKANATLVPIDHGFCLPEFPALGEATFQWMNWRQSREPLHSDLLAYIRSLNVDDDIEYLRQVLGKDMLPERAILTLRVCTMWLQLAASNGLTFYQMGWFLCRPDLDSLSPLERIVAHFKFEHLLSTSHDRILSTLEPAMLQYIAGVRKRSNSFPTDVHCATPTP